MGCPLPGDDKDFIASYGSGNIGGFLWVRNPFSASEDVNLVAFAHDQLGALRGRRAGGELVPYPLHPEPGGLLPWATLFDGAVCYWVTGPRFDERAARGLAHRDGGAGSLAS